MGQVRQYNRHAAYGQRTKTGARTGKNRGMYVYDNTARRLDEQHRIEEPARRPVQNEVRKNRDKAHHMSMGYVMFLSAALIAAGLILVNYVQLQAELTNITKSNADLESTLNYKQLSNDEAYNRVMNSVDLEEVKRIAIGELGMVYAQDGQICTYEGEESDYMRQVIRDTK